MPKDSQRVIGCKLICSTCQRGASTTLRMRSRISLQERDPSWLVSPSSNSSAAWSSTCSCTAQSVIWEKQLFVPAQSLTADCSWLAQETSICCNLPFSRAPNWQPTEYQRSLIKHLRQCDHIHGQLSTRQCIFLPGQFLWRCSSSRIQALQIQICSAHFSWPKKNSALPETLLQHRLRQRQHLLCRGLWGTCLSSEPSSVPALL